METYLFGTPGGDIDALIEGLHDPDEEERKIAEFALFSQGGRALQPLIHALGVDDPAMRMEAARILGDLHQPEAAPALVQALNDANEGVRATAVNALIELRDDAVRPIFERLADGPVTARMREGTYQALRGLEDFGLLRGNLKHMADVVKSNSPAASIQGEAQQMLSLVR